SGSAAEAPYPVLSPDGGMGQAPDISGESRQTRLAPGSGKIGVGSSPGHQEAPHLRGFLLGWRNSGAQSPHPRPNLPRAPGRRHGPPAGMTPAAAPDAARPSRIARPSVRRHSGR